MIGDANREGSPYASILSKHRPDLSSYEALYKRIHANPELSGQESETAETITEYLSKLSSDFDIRTKIGGHGLIAILKNNAVPGETKTVLMRADMDALPVSEDTGFEHASKKTMKDADGQTKPVMHACGHDLHVSCSSRFKRVKRLWDSGLTLDRLLPHLQLQKRFLQHASSGKAPQSSSFSQVRSEHRAPKQWLMMDFTIMKSTTARNQMSY